MIQVVFNLTDEQLAQLAGQVAEVLEGRGTVKVAAGQDWVSKKKAVEVLGRSGSWLTRLARRFPEVRRCVRMEHQRRGLGLWSLKRINELVERGEV